MTNLLHRATMQRTVPEGRTLVELLVALAAGSILLVCMAVLLDAQSRLATDMRHAALVGDAVRTTAAVLGAELRYALPADLRAVTSDSIAIRTMRGVAYPCATESVYRYDGMRRPAVDKDSVVGALTGRAAALSEAVDAAAAALPPDDPCVRAELPLFRLITDPPHAAEPLLLFESGAYHVALGALRYRLGAEGRQPLTEEWLDGNGSGFAASRDDGVPSLNLHWTARSAPRPATSLELRFPPLNRRPGGPDAPP